MLFDAHHDVDAFCVVGSIGLLPAGQVFALAVVEMQTGMPVAA